jgi:predicted TIM-barrel fold metal-dependent hydrolase
MDIVNLLVDYDLWLDDRPSSGSDAPDQWEVWHDIAIIYQKRAKIRTFAGYCPLRHAIESEGGGPTRFAAISAAHKDGKIAGLKLYPPMGFYPSGNEVLLDCCYVASDGAKGRGLANWQNAVPGQPMGPALQKALDATYGWATDHKVPILVHAGQCNHAGREFEDRAHPKGWLPVVRKHPGLRLCLGHFSFKIDDFIAAMETNPPDRVRGGWPLQGTEQMIADSAAGRSNVFVDISYIEEILPGADESCAYKFFRALKKYIEIYDPDCSQLMYGSDWIMLEREAENSDYLKRVSALMQATDWPSSWQANVLRNNLQRFLTQ